MPANTSPDNIVYPVSTDPVAPLETVFAALANSVQTALNKHPYSVADLTALAALTTIPTGSIAQVTEGGALFRYTGSSWIQATTAVFASTAARDTAYAKASGAYRVAEALARVGSLTYRYTGTAWQGWQSPWITYTPTITGITVGNGTLAGRYQFSEGTLLVEGYFLYGTTSAVASSPTLTHPVTADAFSARDQFPLGTTALYDASTTATTMGYVQGLTSTTCWLRTAQIVGSFVNNGGFSSTVPFTWASPDTMQWRYQIGQA